MNLPIPITEVFPFPPLESLQLSHSSRGLFQSCPRKFEFRKIYNNSRRSESMAMGGGTAFHEAIQAYLQDGDEENAIWQLIKNFPIQFQKSWSDQTSLVGYYQAFMNAIAWEGLERFELAYIQKPDGTKVAAVEVPFVLRINDYPFNKDGSPCRIDYIGFIDLIMYDKINDEYAVWDIKTTSRSADANVQFAYDEQCVPYGLVLEALMGHDVNAGFSVSYWLNYIHPVEPKTQQFEFNKSKKDLTDWMQGYMFDLDAMRRYYNLGWFARRSSGCLAWGRPCNFFDFCESRDPKVIEMMLKMENATGSGRDLPEPWAVVELHHE